MLKSSCGTASHLDQFEDHQPECDSVQFKESDKAVSVNAAEEEAVSGPVVILSDVTHQDSAVSDRLQSTELALKSSSLHEIDTALIEVLSEVKQANGTTVEPEEPSTAIKHEPEDQPDLEGPVVKLLGDVDEVENGTETSNSPELQTSCKDQSSSNPYPGDSLDVNGNVMLALEIEESRMDPKARDNHPGRMSVSVVDHSDLEEMCFNSEKQLQAAEVTETLEPPAKKRLRRRMGMCGLGDRKRKFPFDGQQCRQDLIVRQREDETGKGNYGTQHYRYNTVLESDDTTSKDHEGSSRPACKEKQEDEENNGTAVMVEEGEVAEQENRYALSNMSIDEALMNDDLTTGESPAEDRVGKKCTSEDNDAEHMALEHELDLLEDTSTGVGQTVFSPIIGEISNMIQDELLVAAAATYQGIEDTVCGDEPKFLGNEMTKTGQDMKHDVLSEKQCLHADNQVDEGPGEFTTEVEVGQEVSSSSNCTTVEMSEGTVLVAKEVQEAPAGLEESETKLEEQSPPSMAAIEKPDPSGTDLSGPTQKGSDRLFVDSVEVAATSSIEIDDAKGHLENDEPITAVSTSTEPGGGDADSTEGISEPAVPPAAQENHMHVSGGKQWC